MCGGCGDTATGPGKPTGLTQDAEWTHQTRHAAIGFDGCGVVMGRVLPNHPNTTPGTVPGSRLPATSAVGGGCTPHATPPPRPAPRRRPRPRIAPRSTTGSGRRPNVHVRWLLGQYYFQYERRTTAFSCRDAVRRKVADDQHVVRPETNEEFPGSNRTLIRCAAKEVACARRFVRHGFDRR